MKQTILLVDDEMYILQSLRRLLMEDGFHVLTASNGVDGLELLKTNSIQVILSDQRMPLMTGSEFIRKVHELYPEIVCMILSAYIDFEALKEALNDGVIYKFISKPWQDSVLLQYVRDAYEAYGNNHDVKKTSLLSLNRDTLTDLQNRYSFYESLWNQTLKGRKKNNRFAIVYFDIDRFTHINAQIGQRKCDILLQQLAHRLKQFTKDEKKLARLGNDEFVAIVTITNELSSLIEKINTLFSIIQKPIDIDGNKYHLTVSMGICIYPDHGDNPDLLISHASTALKLAEKLGGNHYHVYDSDLDKSCESQLFFEDDLYQALEKRQFRVYYQPIYNLDKTKLVSVEALIRWEHPDKGLLLPGKFLSLCEETNLIVPIGAWVLRAACQQVKLWQSLGFPDLELAINLSVKQFNHPRLLDLIVDVLETTQLNPRCLILEITETHIMQNSEKVISLLHSLRGLGIQLALDDFGTGYSSLSYLRKFPFTSLKIDQSFVSEMAQSSTGAAIVDTIIALGKILCIQVIAEGVETEEQLEILRQKHCDLIQGFLYSRPLPGQDIVKLLMSTKKRRMAS